MKDSDIMTDLKVAYTEICNSHNGIADFRAKLLALLPIASGAGILLIVGDIVGDDPMKEEMVSHLLPVGIFGVVITLGLFFYELRGIQKCLFLVECAKKLESDIVPSELRSFGAFTFRKKGALGGFVGARGAALAIYPAVIAAWSYVAEIGCNRSLNWDSHVGKTATEVWVGCMVFGGVVLFLQDRKLEKALAEAEREKALAEADDSGDAPTDG